jgi:hemerythrin
MTTQINNKSNFEIVSWEEKYATGIDLIDDQHKELVIMTNSLYQACRTKEGDRLFKDAMRDMVDYVRFHFGAEIEMLERIKYPELNEHKKQHDSLIKSILEAAKSFEDGKPFVANNFVRTLKDWIFGHIAISDKLYAAHIADQKKKGLLTDNQIEGK